MTNSTATPDIAEDRLHALVDGRLSPQDADTLRASIAGDEHAAATLQAWKAQREALRRLHRPLLDEPVPAVMAQAADKAAARLDQQDQWWRWGGIAAGIALAFVTGWFGSVQWRSAMDLAVGPGQNFGQQAAVAHVAYLPEMRHPAQVPTAQQERLVKVLSQRLGQPLKVPQLSALGYELVGGRPLPGPDGERAQFMFQNAAGEQVTLYIGALPGVAASAKATSFRYTTQAPVPGFYWIDQGLGYAMAGQLSRQALMDLAHAVYAQP